MKCWLLSALLLCNTLLVPLEADAFIEDPFVTPTHPTPDRPIWVHVRAGWCHAIVDHPFDAELVVVAPDQLQLMTDGIALPPGHPFCNHPPYTYRFNIGKLPEGSYTLQLFISDDFSAAEPIGFGKVKFVVEAPATIPAASVATLTGIFFLLIVTAALASSPTLRE